ncbi:MAG TPA: ThiF family adenylyltransferase, partial [Acidobacteriota bacterium]|nr:ThiF family adenylyltransferase [Acidobacteriota bacterium]
YQRLKLIRWWDQDKLRNARILVVGAGALGNEVVKNLALLGIGHVWIADFDRIETTNLTRSVMFRAHDVGLWKSEVLAARASEINPDSKFTALRCDVRYDLGLGFLSKLNFIFGCLDNREARYQINRYCYLLRKPFIDGGLDTLNGSVSFFHPPETACYECTLSAVDRAELQKRISCLKSTDPEIKHHVPTAPSIASIIGGLQVQLGVRHLHSLQVPAGKRLGLYGLSDVFFDIALEISEDCGLHTSADTIPEVQKLDVPETVPLQSVLMAAKQAWNAERLVWDFDRDVINSLSCIECEKKVTFIGTHSLYNGSAFCDCGGTFKSQIAISFEGVETWGNKSFRELGFPSDHIYCAETKNDRRFFTLA